ncbi:MAG: hypothetical protein ACI9IP_003272 [Arcticibacterium sp.]
MQKRQIAYRKYIQISLFYLLIVAIIGTVLRSVAFFNIPFEYANLVHAHSHVAFQGWVYTAIFLIITSLYISPEKVENGRYLLQFKLTVLILIGVLVSFTLYGYGLYSIISSTLFQILNYWFIYRFFKDVKTSSPRQLDLLLVKTGLGLGLLSSFFPYFIGFVSAKGYAGSELYKSLVYSFMHLQYNGWFLFIIIGLFYKLLDLNQITYTYSLALKFYKYYIAAVIPAISLSLLGMSFSNFLIIPAYLAVAFSAMGLLFFMKSFSMKDLAKKTKQNPWFPYFILLFIVGFILKVCLQTLSIIPGLNAYAFFNKLIFLAYLHLSLIGVISFLLIAVIIHLKWIPINSISKVGFTLLILGFLVTELVLTLGGFSWSSTQVPLFAGSAAMAVGILLLNFSLILNHSRD